MVPHHHPVSLYTKVEAETLQLQNWNFYFPWYDLRASPMALYMHLHMCFFSRDADADARSKPSGPC